MAEDKALSLLNGLPAIKNWILGKFVQKETGKGLSANDFTLAEKEKLTGIAESANKYVHPSYTTKAAGAYKVTIDASGHVSAAVPITKEDITNLGIPAQDTTYEVFDPATSAVAGGIGLVPAPGAGTQTKYLRGDGTFQTPPNTTYAPATAAADGLMNKADFSKLAAFQAAANYALKSELLSVYKYKSSVPNEAGLPTTGQIIGDTYNVIAKSSYGPAGMNVAWNGTAWDAMGGSFEIDYATAAEVLEILNA